jgi:hypothetical protein
VGRSLRTAPPGLCLHSLECLEAAFSEVRTTPVQPHTFGSSIMLEGATRPPSSPRASPARLFAGLFDQRYLVWLRFWAFQVRAG